MNENSSKENSMEDKESNNLDFLSETENLFDVIWKDIKADIKEMSKKDVARQMFISGALMSRESLDRYMTELLEKIEQNPEKAQEILKDLKSSLMDEGANKNDLWEEGYFAETTDSKDMEAKMRTFRMKHDEEMDYNCKICDKKISAHNKDWHAGMCDGCFNKTYHKNV